MCRSRSHLVRRHGAFPDVIVALLHAIGTCEKMHGRNKFEGGTGAGLTFSKQIAERHGGKIWVESTDGEGRATYFTIPADT